MHNFSNRVIAFARSAGATSNVAFDATDRTPEQATALAKLLSTCAALTPPVDPAAVYAAAASADPVTRVRKPKPEAKPADAPKPEAAKPEAPRTEKPSKPANEAKANDYAQRVELIDKLRDAVAGIYNGPSLAVRTNPKRFPASTYADLLRTPKHRTVLAKLTERDESALFLIIKRGERGGSFDPVYLNLDAGIFSRLASVGFIEADGTDSFKLSPDALAHARSVVRRQAKAA